MVFPIKVHGGEFLPRIGHYGLNSGPFQQLEHYNVGEPKRYVPALTSEEAFGPPNASATTSFPYGGNGVNHFSALGMRAIYSPLLNEEALTAAFADSGRYVPTFSGAANLASYSVEADAWMWSRSGNIVAVTGELVLKPSASGLVTLDSSLPIQSFFDASNSVAGVATASAVAGITGAFFGNSTTDTARLQLVATSTATLNVKFQFTYEIR